MHYLNLTFHGVEAIRQDSTHLISVSMVGSPEAKSSEVAISDAL
jgi:hypothetical protein